ncbi:LppC family lipoprotein [Halovibrio salipaludis]|uniref:LppC family lipoprotein n=1 Tax=Halovibrio salipaludis TaxID=2032626 RepID=A0A2A2F2V9_9GAMM|nr:penicillin-binding protein activator [Halovibrio salipaludis]PAU79951.1 LppC family lipoprotein [Halovibrio salipaludis]
MTIRLPVLTVFLLLFVAGCAVEPVSTPEQQPTTIQGLLSGAADTNDASLRRQYQLKAAQMLQSDGEYASARSLLDAMDPGQIEDELRDRYLWLSSRDAVERSDADAAETLADQLDPELPLRLPPEQRANAFEAVTGVYELAGRHLPNARTLILWNGSDARQPETLNQRIWRALREVPRSELAPVAERSSDYRERGWLELALALAAHEQHEVEARSRAIRDWQKAWPDHGAAAPFPGELALLRQLDELRPESVALALPLSGPLGGAGEAVREGFLAAYYQDLADPDRTTPDISVHDTHASTFSGIYGDLLKTDPDLVVGPLSKEAVEELTSLPALAIPVLALNYHRDALVTPENLFQFGLGSEDEMQAITQRIKEDGHSNVLAVLPEGDWGVRMEKALRSAADKQGITLLETVQYGPDSNLNRVVADGFNINQSRQRANALMRLTGTTMRFEPRRRQDVDALVLLASPEDARQINPLFAFYYGGDLPVYGSSLLYRGSPDPARDSDLDGIRFTDIPWVLGEAPPERDSLQSLFPALANNYDRLFALGFDSYRLTHQIQLLREIEAYRYQGVTGMIRNSANGRFQRTPDWAVFRKGEPGPLPEAAKESAGRTDHE